jgi:hypothetical protein
MDNIELRTILQSQKDYASFIQNVCIKIKIKNISVLHIHMPNAATQTSAIPHPKPKPKPRRKKPKPVFEIKHGNWVLFGPTWSARTPPPAPKKC